MFIFKEKKKLHQHLQALHFNKKFGFVPTMGFLHEGHLSLIERAKTENDVVIVSIFVNPTQFNNPNDLKNYPKNITRDLELIRYITSKAIVYIPESDDIYSNGLETKSFNFNGLENVMEGAFRKKHFDGVATILLFFFRLINPTNAYFGEKDFQQLRIVMNLVKQYNLSINIVSCPIFREKNGLAMSSRNERLSKKGREKAGVIYKVLLKTKESFGSKTIQELKNEVSISLKKHSEFKIEYIEITDIETLQSNNTIIENKKYRLFLALFLEDIRLIDNISLNY